MLDAIFKINKKINVNGINLLEKLNKEDQRNFIDKLYKENMTEIERSFNQYKCQIKGEDIFKRLFNNIIGFMGIIPFIFYCVLMNGRKGQISNNSKDKTAVFWGTDLLVVPETLNKEYVIKMSKVNYRLNYKDIKFLFSELFLKHPFSFYFNMKIIFKIALYRENMDVFKPICFIVNSEYSFTSSILTKYCNNNGIMHINVMHGDKFYYIRDSFFKFNKCYIWDEHYKKLFINLKAEPNQFEIEIPKNFIIPSEVINKRKKIYNLTYYLQDDEENNLKLIRENLRKIKTKFNITVRPHPRYCDEKKIIKYFNEFQIENSSKVNINESIANTDYAVSLYSTVLFQAYYNNKKIIIDDLIDFRFYKKLNELDYIIINKEHKKLSELVI